MVDTFCRKLLEIKYHYFVLCYIRRIKCEQLLEATLATNVIGMVYGFVKNVGDQ